MKGLFYTCRAQLFVKNISYLITVQFRYWFNTFNHICIWKKTCYPWIKLNATRRLKNSVRKYNLACHFRFVFSLEQNAFCSSLDVSGSWGQATQGVYKQWQQQKHENWLQCCCTRGTENPVFALETWTKEDFSWDMNDLCHALGRTAQLFQCFNEKLHFPCV